MKQGAGGCTGGPGGPGCKRRWAGEGGPEGPQYLSSHPKLSGTREK